MIERIGRRLRLRFQGPETVVDDSPPSATPIAPMVDFVAYAEDCILSGRISLAEERLTDLLNDHDEYVLSDVLVERFDDSPATLLADVMVRRDEILLVHATGPRGSAARRRRTRQHPLALQLGPYHVLGYLHVLPGSDPLAAIRRRKPMVPLTDARIEVGRGSGRQRRRVGVVVVNRERLDWAVPALDDEAEMPDLPVQAEHGPLVKDFTGQLLVEPMDPALG